MALVKRKSIENEPKFGFGVREVAGTMARLKENHLLSLPIDVYAIAEFLGLDVQEEAMDDELSGYIEPRGGGWVIGVNAFHHPNRQRFTVAHELGHFLLHKPDERHVDVTFARRSGGRNRVENEADKFAADLLMPEAEVREFVASRQASLEAFAARFKVSIMAAKYRVQSLGYSVR